MTLSTRDGRSFSWHIPHVKSAVLVCLWMAAASRADSLMPRLEDMLGHGP
jgi:hypothetical protein